MSPRPARVKIGENRDKQRQLAATNNLDRLARSIGPQVAYVVAPYCGEQILVQRPDLTALTTHKDWPQPLTSMARTLITEGDTTLKSPEKIDDYLDLQYRVVVKLARIEPEELATARAQDEAEFEDAQEAWNAEHKAALEAGDQEAAGALQSRRPLPKNAHRDEALMAIDVADLRPLFVTPGEAPDEDQLVLLRPGDGAVASGKDGTFRFTINDLYALMGQIMTVQAGGLITFRR